MGGVAYTTSTDLDRDHKEIHFSLDYIANIRPRDRVAHEIEGVLTHELVHCYQYDGTRLRYNDSNDFSDQDDDDDSSKSSGKPDDARDARCPGGLIEGIADWIRLRCDLGPPHWHRDEKQSARRAKSWDRGYESTAFFLDHLESRFGQGTVARINGRLRVSGYHEDRFWPALLGESIEELWEEYCCAGEPDDNNGDGCGKGKK